MNQRAEKHLVKAKTFIEKGDSFYAKAADEIIAAMAADHTLSNREIGERFNRSREWVRVLVQWRTSGKPSGAPINWQRGSHATTEEIEAGAKKLLAEGTPEQVTELVGEALQREDVIEHLAEDDEAMESFITSTSKALNRSAKKDGIDYEKDRRVDSSNSPTLLDKMKARVEIHLRLVQAVEIAIEHNLEDFILEFIEDAREKVEMSLAAGNPKQAVEELEAWLHEQPEAEEV